MFELHFAGSNDSISAMEMIDPLTHLHHDHPVPAYVDY